MSRLREIVLRRPPVVAPPESLGLAFGFATQQEIEGWTVNAHGADGRRLGRPLKGLSSSALATLTRPATAAGSASELGRLGNAWTQACRQSATNAEVLTAFADAAALISAPAGQTEAPQSSGE